MTHIARVRWKKLAFMHLIKLLIKHILKNHIVLSDKQFNCNSMSQPLSVQLYFNIEIEDDSG
jgi:hypothetical protein